MMLNRDQRLSLIIECDPSLQLLFRALISHLWLALVYTLSQLALHGTNDDRMA